MTDYDIEVFCNNFDRSAWKDMTLIQSRMYLRDQLIKQFPGATAFDFAIVMDIIL